MAEQDLSQFNDEFIQENLEILEENKQSFEERMREINLFLSAVFETADSSEISDELSNVVGELENRLLVLESEVERMDIQHSILSMELSRRR